MSLKKKAPGKLASKPSILSYFLPQDSSPLEKFQKTTLGTRNQNHNSSKKASKRKAIEKYDFTSPQKESKIVNCDPIVISSDGSVEDENSDFRKVKRCKKSPFSIKKRKSRRKADNFAMVGELPKAESCLNDSDNLNCSGLKELITRTRERSDNGREKRLQRNEQNLPDTECSQDGSFDGKIVPQIEHLNDTLTGSGNDCDENDSIFKPEMENEQDSLSPKTKFGKLVIGCRQASDTASQGFVKDHLLSDSDKQSKSNINEDQVSGENTKKVAYYLLNFRKILDTVLDNDDDRALFEGTDDMAWIDKFNNLSLDAQKLYVRLYHRKVVWRRLEQINYPDISRDMDRVLLKLAEWGFLLSFDFHNRNDLELKDILRLLPATALKNLAKSYKINVNGRQKTQITNDICKLCRKQMSVLGGFFGKKSQKSHCSKADLENSVLRRACKALGPCYKVVAYPRTVFNRVLLVFDVTRGLDDEQECSLTGSQNAMGQGRHLQLSAILMAGMGKVCYPVCEVDRPTPIFSRRADLLHYETAFQFQTDVLSCIEAGQWQEAADLCRSANAVRLDIKENDEESCERAEMLPEFLRCFTAQWTYTRLRSLEVEILQRLKRYGKAVEILQELLGQRQYCMARRGHWWERLALNVDQHLKDPVRSLNVIHESLQDRDVRVGHKLALAQRVSKILASKMVKKLPQQVTTFGTKLKPIIDRMEIEEAPVVEITGRLLPGEVQTGKSRFVVTERDDGADTESTILCSVEELALSHYKSLGYDHGIHGEGGTFSTLFCLFLWDIIFMPGIPDVFRTLYQTHPLDYHTDGFYLRREAAIKKRLDLVAKLEDEDFISVEEEKEKQDSESSALDVMSMTWDMEYGKACAGMNWERFTSIEDAKGFVKCVGGKVLSGVFRRFAKDLRHTRSGLPDLVVWNPEKGVYKMVEVKGPGDRLSTNQRLWIDELVRLNANIEVCRVVAIGGKKLSRD